MHRLLQFGLILACLAPLGCRQSSDANPTAPPTENRLRGVRMGGMAAQAEAPPTPQPLPFEGGEIALSEENVRVVFRCKRAGKEKGAVAFLFEKIDGIAVIDEETKSLKSLRIEFDTASVTSGDDEIDAQLRGDEFFDVEKHPKLVFEGNILSYDEEEKRHRLGGKMTLKGVTNPNTVTCIIRFPGEGIRFSGVTRLDRTDYAMHGLINSFASRFDVTIDLGLPSKLRRRRPRS